MPELTAPLVFKNEEKRIVYGPVLIPDEPDTDDDVVTAEQIEEVAHKFVEEYGNIDLQHSLNNVGKMIESYILPMDLPVDDDLTVPKGSWMLGVRVTDEDSWEAVKDGKLGGFSIMAINKVAMKSAKTTAEKNSAQKRTTLADLQDGWIVNAVSLVDEPAVPKAKFIAIKSKAKKKQTEVTSETVKKALEGSFEHIERLVRSKVYSTFDSDTTDSYVHSTLNDSVIIKINNTLNSTTRMIQLGYEIDEQGNVQFVGEPQEVRIQETVVPIQKSTGNSEESSRISSDKEKDNLSYSEKEKTPEKANNGFLDKVKKMLGIKSPSTEKAGRSISNTNYEKLRAAKEVIDELLSVADRERQSNKSKEGDSEMNKEQVEGLIKSQLQPLDDKLNEIMETFKSGANEEQQEGNDNEKEDKSEKSKGQGEEKEQKAEKSKKEEEQQEETVSKSEYEKLVAELEKVKKNRPFSKRLAGQDGLSAEKSKEAKPDRDAFGYKISE